MRQFHDLPQSIRDIFVEAWFQRASQPASEKNPPVTLMLDLDETCIYVRNPDKASEKSFLTENPNFLKRFLPIDKSKPINRNTLYYDPYCFNVLKRFCKLNHTLIVITNGSYAFREIQQLFLRFNIQLLESHYVNRNKMIPLGFNPFIQDSAKALFIDRFWPNRTDCMLFDNLKINQPQKGALFSFANPNEIFPFDYRRFNTIPTDPENQNPAIQKLIENEQKNRLKIQTKSLLKIGSLAQHYLFSAYEKAQREKILKHESNNRTELHILRDNKFVFEAIKEIEITHREDIITKEKRIRALTKPFYLQCRLNFQLEQDLKRQKMGIFSQSIQPILQNTLENTTERNHSIIPRDNHLSQTELLSIILEDNFHLKIPEAIGIRFNLNCLRRVLSTLDTTANFILQLRDLEHTKTQNTQFWRFLLTLPNFSKCVTNYYTATQRAILWEKIIHCEDTMKLLIFFETHNMQSVLSKTHWKIILTSAEPINTAIKIIHAAAFYEEYNRENINPPKVLNKLEQTLSHLKSNFSNPNHPPQASFIIKSLLENLHQPDRTGFLGCTYDLPIKRELARKTDMLLSLTTQLESFVQEHDTAQTNTYSATKSVVD